MGRLKSEIEKENKKLKDTLNMYFEDDFIVNATPDEIYEKLRKQKIITKRLSLALYSLGIIFLCLAFFIMGLMM